MREDVYQWLTKELTDQGKIVDAGFVGPRLMAYDGVPEGQIEDMRRIFFAGAHHIFHSIMQVLDPGLEPTDKDMERLSLIQGELDIFIQKFELEHLPAKGQA